MNLKDQIRNNLFVFCEACVAYLESIQPVENVAKAEHPFIEEISSSLNSSYDFAAKHGWNDITELIDTRLFPISQKYKHNFQHHPIGGECE